jgi:hypothetical protein
MSKPRLIKQKTYKYGFQDTNLNQISLNKGLSEAVVRKISAIKREPA